DYLLSKKDKKKREKAAGKRGVTFDSEPSEPPTPVFVEPESSVETPQEETDDYPLGKKDKKKRDKALQRSFSEVPSPPVFEPEAPERVDESPVTEVEPSEADTPKLSKKEQKKRDQEARQQGFSDVAAEAVIAAAGVAAVAAARAEEPEDEWSSSGKKSKKGKKKAREAERDVRDTEPIEAFEPVMTPDTEAGMPGGWAAAETPPEVSDPFQYQVQDEPSPQPEADPWTEPADTKKSKKKKKRDSGRFNEPAASSPLRSEWNYDDYMGEQANAGGEATHATETLPTADPAYTNGHSHVAEKSSSDRSAANGSMTAEPEEMIDDRAREGSEHDDERHYVAESLQRTSPEEGRSHSVASEPIADRESRRKSKSEKARSEVGYADDPDYYDNRSVAGSEPADLNGSSKASKRRSKREDDDTASVVSSRSRREKEESPVAKKEKKGGLFGMFSRKSSETVPLSRQSTRSDEAPLSRTSTRESRDGEDENGERKHRKKKHREGSAYGDDDDARSVVSESRHRHHRDRDEQDDDGRERRRSSRHGDDDLDTKSEPGRQHRHRNGDDDDDDTMSRASEGGHHHHRCRRTDDEAFDAKDPSFLGIRVEDLPPLPTSTPQSPALAPINTEQDIGHPVSAEPDAYTLDHDRDLALEGAPHDIPKELLHDQYSQNMGAEDASQIQVAEPLSKDVQPGEEQPQGGDELAQLPALPGSRPGSPSPLVEATTQYDQEDELPALQEDESPALPSSRPESPTPLAEIALQHGQEDEIKQPPAWPSSRPGSPTLLAETAETTTQYAQDDELRALPNSMPESPTPFAETTLQHAHEDEVGHPPALSSRPGSPTLLAETTTQYAQVDELRDLPNSMPESPTPFAETTLQHVHEDEVGHPPALSSRSGSPTPLAETAWQYGQGDELPALPSSRPESPTPLAEAIMQHSYDNEVGQPPVLSSRPGSPTPFAETTSQYDQEDELPVRPESPTLLAETTLQLGREDEVEQLPALPTSRPGSPTVLPETPSRPARLARPTSTTAIPLRFPFGHHTPQQKERSGSFGSPVLSAPASPVSAQKKPRPSSTEIRPLYLVERNRKAPEVEDTLPSLPSSKTTSRASSVQGSDDWHSAAEDFPSPRSARDLVIDTDHANAYRPDDDYLDSQETTPKASEFPQTALVRSARKEPQFYTWEDFEQDERLHNAPEESHDESIAPPPLADESLRTAASELEQPAPQPTETQAEDLPVLPDSRPESPTLIERPDHLSHGGSASIAGAAVLGSAAILAQRALKQHDDEDRRLDQGHEPTTRDTESPSQSQVYPLPDLKGASTPDVSQAEEPAELPVLLREGSSKKKKKGKKGKKAVFEDSFPLENEEAVVESMVAATPQASEFGAVEDSLHQDNTSKPTDAPMDTVDLEYLPAIRSQNDYDQETPLPTDTEPPEKTDNADAAATGHYSSHNDSPDVGSGSQELPRSPQTLATTPMEQEQPSLEDPVLPVSRKLSKKAKKKQKAVAWQDLDDDQSEPPTGEQLPSHMPAFERSGGLVEPTDVTMAGSSDPPVTDSTRAYSVDEGSPIGVLPLRESEEFPSDTGTTKVIEPIESHAAAGERQPYPNMTDTQGMPADTPGDVADDLASDPAVSGNRELTQEDSVEARPLLARKKSKKDKKSAKRQQWESAPSDIIDGLVGSGHEREASGPPDDSQATPQQIRTAVTPDSDPKPPTDVPLPTTNDEEIELQPASMDDAPSATHVLFPPADVVPDGLPSPAHGPHAAEQDLADTYTPAQVPLPEAGPDELACADGMPEQPVSDDQHPLKQGSANQNLLSTQAESARGLSVDTVAPEDIPLPNVSDAEGGVERSEGQAVSIGRPSNDLTEADKDTAFLDTHPEPEKAPNFDSSSVASTPDSTTPPKQHHETNYLVPIPILDMDSPDISPARDFEALGDAQAAETMQVEVTNDTQIEFRDGVPLSLTEPQADAGDTAMAEQPEDLHWEPTSKKSKKGKKGKKSGLATPTTTEEPATADDTRGIEEAGAPLDVDTPSDVVGAAVSRVEEPDIFWAPSSGKKKKKKGKTSAMENTQAVEEPLEEETLKPPGLTTLPEATGMPGTGILDAHAPTTNLPETDQSIEDSEAFWGAPVDKKKGKKAKKSKQLSVTDAEEAAERPNEDADFGLVLERGNGPASMYSDGLGSDGPPAADTQVPTSEPEAEQAPPTIEPSAVPEVEKQDVDQITPVLQPQEDDDDWDSMLIRKKGKKAKKSKQVIFEDPTEAAVTPPNNDPMEEAGFAQTTFEPGMQSTDAGTIPSDVSQPFDDVLHAQLPLMQVEQEATMAAEAPPEQTHRHDPHEEPSVSSYGREKATNDELATATDPPNESDPDVDLANIATEEMAEVSGRAMSPLQQQVLQDVLGADKHRERVLEVAAPRQNASVSDVPEVDLPDAAPATSGFEEIARALEPADAGELWDTQPVKKKGKKGKKARFAGFEEPADVTEALPETESEHIVEAQEIPAEVSAVEEGPGFGSGGKKKKGKKGKRALIEDEDPPSPLPAFDEANPTAEEVSPVQDIIPEDDWAAPANGKQKKGKKGKKSQAEFDPQLGLMLEPEPAFADETPAQAMLGQEAYDQLDLAGDPAIAPSVPLESPLHDAEPLGRAASPSVRERASFEGVDQPSNTVSLSPAPTDPYEHEQGDFQPTEPSTATPTNVEPEDTWTAFPASDKKKKGKKGKKGAAETEWPTHSSAIREPQFEFTQESTVEAKPSTETVKEPELEPEPDTPAHASIPPPELFEPIPDVVDVDLDVKAPVADGGIAGDEWTGFAVTGKKSKGKKGKKVSRTLEQPDEDPVTGMGQVEELEPALSSRSELDVDRELGLVGQPDPTVDISAMPPAFPHPEIGIEETISDKHADEDGVDGGFDGFAVTSKKKKGKKGKKGTFESDTPTQTPPARDLPLDQSWADASSDTPVLGEADPQDVWMPPSGSKKKKKAKKAEQARDVEEVEAPTIMDEGSRNAQPDEPTDHVVALSPAADIVVEPDSAEETELANVEMLPPLPESTPLQAEMLPALPASPMTQAEGDTGQSWHEPEQQHELVLAPETYSLLTDNEGATGLAVHASPHQVETSLERADDLDQPLEAQFNRDGIQPDPDELTAEPEFESTSLDTADQYPLSETPAEALEYHQDNLAAERTSLRSPVYAETGSFQPAHTASDDHLGQPQAASDERAVPYREDPATLTTRNKKERKKGKKTREAEPDSWAEVPAEEQVLPVTDHSDGKEVGGVAAVAAIDGVALTAADIAQHEVAEEDGWPNVSTKRSKHDKRKAKKSVTSISPEQRTPIQVEDDQAVELEAQRDPDPPQLGSPMATDTQEGEPAEIAAAEGDEWPSFSTKRSKKDKKKGKKSATETLTVEPTLPSAANFPLDSELDRSLDDGASDIVMTRSTQGLDMDTHGASATPTEERSQPLLSAGQEYAEANTEDKPYDAEEQVTDAEEGVTATEEGVAGFSVKPSKKDKRKSKKGNKASSAATPEENTDHRSVLNHPVTPESETAGASSGDHIHTTIEEPTMGSDNPKELLPADMESVLPEAWGAPAVEEQWPTATTKRSKKDKRKGKSGVSTPIAVEEGTRSPHGLSPSNAFNSLARAPQLHALEPESENRGDLFAIGLNDAANLPLPEDPEEDVPATVVNSDDPPLVEETRDPLPDASDEAVNFSLPNEPDEDLSAPDVRYDAPRKMEEMQDALTPASNEAPNLPQPEDPVEELSPRSPSRDTPPYVTHPVHQNIETSTDSYQRGSGQQLEHQGPTQDIAFAATLAAGLADSGFDPNMVVEDPVFHRRSSPPGTVAEADPEEVVTTTTAKRVKKGKKAKRGQAFVEPQPAAEEALRDGEDVAEEQPMDDFDATLTRSLQGAGFDPAVLQRAISPSGGMPLNEVADDEPGFSFTSSKRKKKGKKGKGTVFTDETGDEPATGGSTTPGDREISPQQAVKPAGSQPSQNELVAARPMSTQSIQDPFMEQAQHHSPLQPELLHEAEPNNSIMRSQTEQQPLPSTEVGSTSHAPPVEDAAAAILLAGDRDMDVDEMDKAYSAYKKKDKRKKKKTKVAALEAENFQQAEASDAAPTTAEDARPYDAAEDNFALERSTDEVVEPSDDPPLETTSTPPRAFANIVDDNHEASFSPVSPAGNRVQSVFPGLQRVKRRQPSETSPTFAIHPTKAPSAQEGLLHTSEVTQSLPMPFERNPPQPQPLTSQNDVEPQPEDRAAEDEYHELRRDPGRQSPSAHGQFPGVALGAAGAAAAAIGYGMADTRPGYNEDHSEFRGGRTPQPAPPIWSFDTLEDKGVARAESPLLGNDEHQVARDSGYQTAGSPRLQRQSVESTTHDVPDIRTSQSRESLRSRRSAEPLHINTDGGADWSLDVPKDRDVDADARAAGTHSRTPSREAVETPLESTTKNRASYLFQSPPANLREIPDALDSVVPSAKPDATHQSWYAATDAARDLSENVRHPAGDSRGRSALSPPPGGPISPRAPLDSIPEEQHPKRSKANSDVGGPDAIKALRRTETPQAIRTSKTRAFSPPTQPQPTATIPMQAFRSSANNPLSTDHLINRLSWPAVDEDNETVNINRSLKRKPSPRIVSDQRSPSVLSNRSNISASQQLRSPEDLRSYSRTSNRSSTPTLRRIDRSLSGDLRSASRRSLAGSAAGSAVGAMASPKTIPFEPPPTPPLNHEDVIDDSAARAAAMSDDVFQGYGDAQGSQVSPTRPPSVRKRQSMHISDLESKMDYLVAENRALQDAKQDFDRTHQATSYQHDVNNQAMHEALDARDLQLQEKDAEIHQIRAILEPLQDEIARLHEFNGGLTEANRNLVDDTNGRYATLQQEHAHAHEQWQNASLELDSMRQEHGRLTTGMRGVIASEVATALADKNVEVLRLREELGIATEQIRALQVQIQSSKSNDFLTFRDEDYFDGACQKLCQHVQQWVLRFSKLSDNRICRLSTDLSDEKIEARLDNAILDGSDVDKLLGDRIRRREVFMSVVMTMVWEYVFTRYLFGMDREQRQKLKTLEKILAEVGPPRAVAQWRATTLTLLSKRPDFARQCALDTEAVAHEIFAMLCALLPPPSNAEQQLVTSLQKVIGVAVDVSVEMRTQRAEYIMLPPLQPEYDRNGDLVRKVHFNASLMNERSGLFSSNEELERERAVVKIVLFPLVVKKGDEVGEGEEEIVVCPAQVLVHNEGGRGKKVVRVLSGAMEIDDPRRSRQSLASTTPGSAAF
ncbi:hypothetical protein LTR36_010434, partial [Oleoguttula mirabilis]